MLPAMVESHKLMLVPDDLFVSTQGAAELLNTSHEYLLGLLDSGEIKFRESKWQCLIELTDLLEYREHRSEVRRRSFQRMCEIAEQSGMYELTATPVRTR